MFSTIAGVVVVAHEKLQLFSHPASGRLASQIVQVSPVQVFERSAEQLSIKVRFPEN